MAAPMAHYMALHDSRFTFSHDSATLSCFGLEHYVLGENVIMQLRKTSSGTFVPYHACLNYLHRPDDFFKMSFYQFIMQCVVVSKEEARRSGKEIFRFAADHPMANDRVLIFRDRDAIPVFPWNWLPYTKDFKTDFLAPVDEDAPDYNLKEKYARRFMMLFMPFRMRSQLQKDESYSRRLQEAYANNDIDPESMMLANNIQNIRNSLDSTLMNNHFPEDTFVEDLGEDDEENKEHNDTFDVEAILKQVGQLVMPPSYKEKISEEARAFDPYYSRSKNHGPVSIEYDVENLPNVFENPIDVPRVAQANRIDKKRKRFCASHEELNRLVIQNCMDTKVAVNSTTRMFEKELELDATGSWTSILVWGKSRKLDPEQMVAFEVLASTFVLDFIEEAEFPELQSISSKENTNALRKLARMDRRPERVPLVMFITGPAGAGKSTLLDALMSYARKFSQNIGYGFHRGSIRLTAYTGCAATEIGGDTTTREFKLARTSKSAKIEDISEFKDLRMVVVDEVSFLDHDRDLQKLSDNLQNFTECREHMFGSRPIVFLGDFRQLFPVGGKSILEFPGSMLWERAINCMVELKGTHRFAKCPALKEIMPALHQKGLSDEHRETLNSRVIDGEKVTFPDLNKARVATFHNANRCDHNNLVFREYLQNYHANCNLEENNIPRTAIVIKCRPCWGQSKQPLSATFRKILFEYCSDSHLCNARNEKCDPFLTLISQCPVMGTKNTDVANGIANGTCATFERAVFRPGKSAYPIQLYGKWVYAIDIEDVDYLVLKWSDSKFKGRFKIKPESGAFRAKFPVWSENGSMTRLPQTLAIEHFPILVNYATTGHKLQGKSVNCLVVSEWSKAENWAYVVLSRVRTLEGLYLTSPIPLDISFEPSKAYFEMMEKVKRYLVATTDTKDFWETEEARELLARMEAIHG